MISLVLYGRNDSYGYNLHKRAAISLNCMAELLSDPSDEIIFVDYNTPDDFPTFPEAIADTLTEKAKSLLRILRVRPKHHERFRSKTHLVALEPVSRNVAIRRSNPRNRWILSTNTDMVFVPRRGKTLSEIAANLKDGYYHLPRFEVPETLWESVDRLDPLATIAAFERWGREFHLNEIVFAQDPRVFYDAPGDFQLILRDDLWKIHGFDESMVLGWHVDSNMAKRLSLLHPAIGDLVEDVFGYHCDHTRQVTPMHRPQGTQNDLKVYFEFVRHAAVKKQAKSWGLAGEQIEEISLGGSRSYALALDAAIPQQLSGVTTIRYAGATFNQIDYAAEHVVPFVADSLSSYPRDTVLAWGGAKRALLFAFARTWLEMGFTEPILVFSQDRWLGPELPDGCVWASNELACRRADAFVFDWGKPESAAALPSWAFDRDPIIRQVARHFRSALRHERWRIARGAKFLRRFIGVNAINNAMEGIFSNHIGAARTPIATRIRQGFIVDAPRADLLASLYIGDAGHRLASGIHTLSGKRGYVFFGPYLDLDSAVYRFSIELDKVRVRKAGWTGLTLEIVSNSILIACRELTKKDLSTGALSLDFYLPREIADAEDWPRVEFRLKTAGRVDFRVTRAALDNLGERAKLEEHFEIAPLLETGPAGRRQARAVHARPGIADLVTYGPYFWLLPGRYEATFQFHIDRSAKDETIRVYVARNLGRTSLGETTIPARRKGAVTCVIAFQVEGEPPLPESGLLEFLVWSRGVVGFSLTSLTVRPAKTQRRVRQAAHRDAGILPLLATQRAGRRLPGTILALGGARGVVFRSANLPLPAGPQRLHIALRVLRSARGRKADTGLTMFAMDGPRVVATQRITATELQRGRATFDFDVVSSGWGAEIQLVLQTRGLVEAEMTSVTLGERRASPGRVHTAEDMVASSP